MEGGCSDELELHQYYIKRDRPSGGTDNQNPCFCYKIVTVGREPSSNLADAGLRVTDLSDRGAGL